jgi:polyhydroxybutyrate depolymerase
VAADLPLVRVRACALAAVAAALLLVAACSAPSGNGSGTTSTTSSTSSPAPSATTAGARRAAQVYVPPGYNRRTPAPLVILLHGYSGTSASVGEYINLQPAAAARGFLLVRPNGTKDRSGQQFWNATDACCDLDSVGVDDSAYLASVIKDIGARYAVDPKRVYVVGHSNGGFMAHRMACDHANLVAAIVSLAGATFDDQAKCRPSTTVSVLEVHGTADNLIPYDGGSIGGAEFPSAPVTARDWATLDHCQSAPKRLPDLDIVGQADTRSSTPQLTGADTQVQAYEGCGSSASVQLWSIQGGGHIPGLTPAFATNVVAFLLAHPKP